MNAMNGYGEFLWQDGKRYRGFYINDKKEGFGIYYWPDPVRIYIGFWKNGKQDGLGKYLSSKSIKWGKWIAGEKALWYNTRQEAFKDNEVDQNTFKNFFDYDINACSEFIKN